MSVNYFEDYEIGAVRDIGSVTVSREETIEFALRYDPQPFHVDEDAARESIFGGLTASSCHTFALMSQIHARHGAAHGERAALVANLGADSLKFPAPVRPGDTLHMTSECLSKRPSRSRPGIGIVTTRTVLTNQDGGVVMEMNTNFMIERRRER